MTTKTLFILLLISTLCACSETKSANDKKDTISENIGTPESDFSKSDKQYSLPSDCESFILDILNEHQLVQKKSRPRNSHRH